MKHFYLYIAAFFAACSLPSLAQNPFEQQTKAIYIWNVEHQQFLSDYQSPTPGTYCLQNYGPSRRDAQMFEITTLNAASGESVLYSPWTDKYMNVPTAGGFAKAEEEVEKRSVLTVKTTEDGHNLIYNGTTILSPYKNGAIMLLVGFTESQFSTWGKIEECKWDFVEPEDLDAFLVAHDIDPEYDPYVDPTPDPDPDPEPDPDKASFEDLQYAVMEAHAALLAAKGGFVAKGDGLITDAFLFHSAYSDSEEGADFGALIDGDEYSFWHSDWHGTAPEGPHSFDVLMAKANTLFVAEYCGRLNGNNCSPIEMSIYGTTIDPSENEDGGYSTSYTMADAPFTTITQTDGLGAFAGWGHSNNSDVLRGSFAFEADDFYDVFRFEAATVVSDAGYGAENCFNYSEFQLFKAESIAPTVKADAADVEALEMLLEEVYSYTKTEDPTDALAELQALTAKVADASAIHSVMATLPADARLYDLQGRRVNRAQNGVFIVNGKKVVR